MAQVADTIRAQFLTGYAELARSVGLDPLRMLDAVGIPRAALTDPELRVSTSAGRALLETSSRAAEDFALRLSEMRTPSIMGAVALIAREQPTVRAVMGSIVRYISLHSEANVFRVEETDDLAIIRTFMTFPSPGPSRQSAELTLAQLTRVLRLYLGAQWRPRSVSFVHSRPVSLDTHHRIFGPNVLFDQDFDGLVCKREDLDRPNPAADPDMARQIERYIQGLGGSADASLPARVRDLVRGLLSTGHCNAGSIARQLGMDLRTLQRQLAQPGTSFGDIVQAVRMELTVQFLEESDRPLAEVAELLGFSALSAFSRWHRTHYGRSASDRREAAHAPAPAIAHA
jgi:AraC-like DNA-binding protein